MTFQPPLPITGVGGWTYLQRTRSSLQDTFNASKEIVRATDHFRIKISNVLTAEDLVNDRQLLAVSLGAFGLESDIGNRFFIKKILDDGSLDPDALANRMSDKRYLAFTKAFGFGDFATPNTQLSDFSEKIIELYQTRGFEAAIGRQEPDLRVALGLERDLGAILNKDTSETGLWYSILGTPPLRRLFEGALGIPATLIRLNLDKQVQFFSKKAAGSLGIEKLEQLKDPDAREKLVQSFLARSQIGNGISLSVPGSAALTVLQNTSFSFSPFQ